MTAAWLKGPTLEPQKKRVDAAVAKALTIPGTCPEWKLRLLAHGYFYSEAKLIVETGTYLGRTTTLFAELGASVITVDDYTGSWAMGPNPVHNRDEAWYCVRRNLTPYIDSGKVTCIQANTLDAMFAYTLDSHLKGRLADFFFLDGGHTADVVRKEIIIARARLRSGGLLAGDDYDIAGVKEAVDMCLGKFETEQNCVWWQTVP